MKTKLLPQTAQIKADKENPHLIRKTTVFCSISNKILHTANAIESGSRQYPSTQTL